MKSIIGIIIIAILIALYACCVNSHKIEIVDWANARGEHVVNIEHRTLIAGPYIPVKGAEYFKVETDKNTYWVRYLYGRTIKKEVGENYEDVED